MDFGASRFALSSQVYKWVATDGDQGKQKLNGAIASGDIPDVCQVDKDSGQCRAACLE